MSLIARSSVRRPTLTAFCLVVLLTGMLISVSPAAAIAAWPLVKIGDSGPNVTTVQYLLRHRGYSLTADGQFGSGTEAQVKAFQSANGLTADGIVGSNTWSKLVVSVDVGSTGDAVRGLQTQLRKHGYTTVTVDGTYGSTTSTAVQDFKTKHYLTGGTLVGPTTWQEMTGTSGTSSGTWRTAKASAYGPGFFGNRTACGQTLTISTIGVAHKTMACGTRLKFQGKSGQVVSVTVIDRGPYVDDREFDLTEATVKQMGYTSVYDFGVRTVYWDYN
ncbi:MAG TPA: peptidoglycan-binding protein [Roseiflexaceae bacterium]|nr:peptidoglycan-binding protein [Roseiflexaceae bacterium]